MKPTLLTHRKEINGLLESPLSNPEVSLIITEDEEFTSKNHRRMVEILRYYYDVNFNSACCRLLIFWSLITTLSSIVSIYYAIDAQNRLNEATDNLNLLNGLENSSSSSFKEPRYHDLAHRFAPFVQRASAARRHRHHHHRHKKPKDSQQTDSKSSKTSSKTTSKRSTSKLRNVAEKEAKKQ